MVESALGGGIKSRAQCGLSTTTMKKNLIATVDEDALFVIQSSLGPNNSTEKAKDKEELLAAFVKGRHDTVFVDVTLLASGADADQVDFVKALEPFYRAFPATQIVILSSQENIRNAVQAVKAGAADYLTYPIKPEEIGFVLENMQKSMRLQTELDYYRDHFWKDESRRVVLSLSPKMKAVFEKVRSVARTNTTVLMTGETGTGKGVVAKLLHQHSHRSGGPFISIHCGAIPDTLIESELFGHEKGSFTGAVKKKLGKFELAKGGTLFLDEISTISSSAQIKLLQVLQESIFQRIGGVVDIQTDARVIAASNDDLAALTKQGRFRMDLYYRLNVFPIELPPLRERREDIPMLAKGFLERLNASQLKNIAGVHPQVLKSLRDYEWPGNIRELENLIERAYILEQSSILTPESFPSELFTDSSGQTQVPVDTTLTLAKAREQALEDLERQYLKDILLEHRGRIDPAAAAAGISTRQLRNLMRKHALRKEHFKAAREES